MNPQMLARELAAHGVFVFENGKCKYAEEEYDHSHCCDFFKKRADNNKRFIATIWNEVKNSMAEDKYGEHSKEAELLFIPAVQSLLFLSMHFPKLQENGIVSALNQIVNSDINEFSNRFMMKIVTYRMGIEWVHHLILRDLYICSLLKKWKNLISIGLQTEAIAGPWANIDLPMEERVWEWDDEDANFRGRDKDIRMQPRYYTGLEDYHSPRVKEGFFWREVRNDPYDWDDETDSPYPTRRLLWRS